MARSTTRVTACARSSAALQLAACARVDALLIINATRTCGGTTAHADTVTATVTRGASRPATPPRLLSAPETEASATLRRHRARPAPIFATRRLMQVHKQSHHNLICRDVDREIACDYSG